MIRVFAVLLILAFGVGTACRAAAGGPPAIEVDRTVCAHCGMFVSEPVYAAAYRTSDGEAHVFDDIACMRASAHAEPDRDALVFWFRDAAGDGWLPGAGAVFVRSPQLRTPMGGGLLAYSDRAAAGQAADAHRGEVVESLAELLLDARKESGQ